MRYLLIVSFLFIEFLASILNVMKLLPEIRRVKCRSVQAKLNLFIQFVEENTEIEVYVNKRTEAEKAANKQPFLLCTGSLPQPLNFYWISCHQGKILVFLLKLFVVLFLCCAVFCADFVSRLESNPASLNFVLSLDFNLFKYEVYYRYIQLVCLNSEANTFEFLIVIVLYILLKISKEQSKRVKGYMRYSIQGKGLDPLVVLATYGSIRLQQRSQRTTKQTLYYDIQLCPLLSKKRFSTYKLNCPFRIL